MLDILKIGIIGCGKIAQVRHIPEYLDHPQSKIVAFYNRSYGTAKKFAEKYGGKAYHTIEDLLNSDVDAVSVCTANAYHASVSIQALKAGKHVLCEKPMATTLEDCEAMVETAKKTGKFLMIGQNQRLAKAHVKAREMIESGKLGKVISFQTAFCHPGPEAWTGKKESWFYDKKVASFGVMADLGVHKTDLIHYLMGEKIIKTSAVMATIDKKMVDNTPISVDDNAFAIYTLESGVIGSMHVSWTNYGKEDNSTRIHLEGGNIRCYDDEKYSLIVEKADGTVDEYALDVLTSNKEQTSGGHTSTGIIEAFLDSILTNTPPSISGENVMHSMKVIFANERSAEILSSVNVE